MTTTLLDGQVRCINCHAPLDFQILADGCVYVKPCSACMADIESDAFSDGYSEGYDEGYSKGYDDGYSEGFDEGFDSA